MSQPTDEYIVPLDGDERKVGRVAFRHEINAPVYSPPNELESPASKLEVAHSMDEVRKLIRRPTDA